MKPIVWVRELLSSVVAGLVRGLRGKQSRGPSSMRRAAEEERDRLRKEREELEKLYGGEKR